MRKLGFRVLLVLVFPCYPFLLAGFMAAANMREYASDLMEFYTTWPRAFRKGSRL